MKYVVINVYDREIVVVGIADTSTDATEIMRDDFMSVFTEYYEEEDFENKVGCGNEWELNETEAWLNARIDYDWRIVAVD